jgi:hypothetical protein
MVSKTGTNGNDTLLGGDGNDTLNGAGGHDFIDGRGGRDLLIGGAGHDRMFGRAGNDAMSGNSGNDRLAGGDGNDRLFGQTGNDLLFGGNGNDRIDGGLGNDRLAGGAGDDTLIGTGGGTDTFEGSTGNDAMILSGTLPASVDGGTGIDRANLDALGSSIDLSGALAARFDDLEIVDLGGGKANTLSLSAASVVTMAGGGGAFPDGALLVKGDAGDKVDLDGTWTKGATTGNPFGQPGSYVAYTNGAAQLLVESELAVITDTPPGASIDLGALNGINGFTVIGADGGDQSGYSVSSAGDVNGDGFDDLFIGAPSAESVGGATAEGESCVVFGKASWAGTPSIDLATLDGTNGFRVTGLDAGDGSGFSVSSAGDLNGDGFADLVIGAPFAFEPDSPSEPGGGELYVVFGKASWAGTPAIDIATLDGTNGYRLQNFEEGDAAGFSVSAAGDVNGDGFDDFIYGAPVRGVFREGHSVVVFGDETGAGLAYALIGADVEDFSGTSVSSAGDVNGDGFDDLIVGAPARPYEYGSAGESYVVFGNANLGKGGAIDLSDINGTNGFSLIGIGAGDNSGRSVSSAGDVNGDGFADLIIGASNAEGPGGPDKEGESYVVFGKASWAGTPSLELATLNGANGFRLTGIDGGDLSGFQVSSAGDVNGDGYGDLIIGAPVAGGAGESYVVYGKASWAGTPALDLATLNGANGFRLIGIDNEDLSGHSVSDAGDVNGDGFGDLIIGARAAEGPGGNFDGESYVVFGGNFTGAVTHLGGTGNDSQTGTAAAENFVGGTGNDTMCGNGGADSFQGGGGTDTMIIGAALPLYVNGGSGVDTVNLDARGGQVNLAGLDSARFVDIEKIDLSGTTANTLLLDAQSVTNMTGVNGDAFDDNTLLVKGDAGDSVNLAGAWTKGATLSNPLGESGSYTEYTNGQARVLVEGDLAVVSGVPTSIDLASLDGSAGFRLIGIDGGEGFAFSVASAGDVNDDGFEDVIVSAPFAGEGESYVVFGKESWAGTPALDLANLDGTNGFKLVGLDINDRAGWSVSSAGDINGDGFADMIVGAPEATDDEDPQYGDAYVVFGKADWSAAPVVDPANLDGSNGFKLSGRSMFDSLGISVSSAGDVNGDGFDDVIVGANEVGADPYGNGASYVVFGKADWTGTPALKPSDLDGTIGFGISSSTTEDTGISVSSAGDVNGDGFDDVIVGAPDGFPGDEPYGTGEAFIVFGKANWAGTSINGALLDGTNGFRFVGIQEFDRVGNRVSTAGDLNGDGFADFIVAAASIDHPGGTANEGETYVVFGKADWSGTPTIDRTDLDGTTGFLMADNFATTSAGDVNGDGYDDFIIGVPTAESVGGETNEGVSYLVYGKADWSGTPVFDPTDLNGSNGFRLVGADANDFSGGAVSSAGDVNGDGFDDLLVGASGAESPGGASGEGETYIVFGGNFNGAVTRLGGISDDKLTGTAAAENFVGGTGDDVMNGKGGADAFQGGSGDDVIRVASLDFFVAEGGTGFDTLALDGSNLDLDLTALADSRTRSIEHLDITGSGNNALSLSIADVLSLSDDSNEVRVSGNAGDSIDIGAGWSAAASGGTNGNGTSTIGGQTYQIYTAGQASLLADTDVATTV